MMGHLVRTSNSLRPKMHCHNSFHNWHSILLRLTLRRNFHDQNSCAKNHRPFPYCQSLSNLSVYARIPISSFCARIFHLFQMKVLGEGHEIPCNLKSECFSLSTLSD